MIEKDELRNIICVCSQLIFSLIFVWLQLEKYMISAKIKITVSESTEWIVKIRISILWRRKI